LNFHPGDFFGAQVKMGRKGVFVGRGVGVGTGVSEETVDVAVNTGICVGTDSTVRQAENRDNGIRSKKTMP
jgi:hypothetical protein